jgi:hypothetical protein
VLPANTVLTMDRRQNIHNSTHILSVSVFLYTSHRGAAVDFLNHPAHTHTLTDCTEYTSIRFVRLVERDEPLTEECRLLGYDGTVWLLSKPTFRRNIVSLHPFCIRRRCTSRRTRCKPRGVTVFHPEDGGDMLVRYVGSYKSHTAPSYPRKRRSSLVEP